MNQSKKIKVKSQEFIQQRAFSVAINAEIRKCSLACPGLLYKKGIAGVEESESRSWIRSWISRTLVTL